MKLQAGGVAGLKNLPVGKVLNIININPNAKPWDINGSKTAKIDILAVVDKSKRKLGLAHTVLSRSLVSDKKTTIASIVADNAGMVYLPKGKLDSPLKATVKANPDDETQKLLIFDVGRDFFANVSDDDDTEDADFEELP